MNYSVEFKPRSIMEIWNFMRVFKTCQVSANLTGLDELYEEYEQLLNLLEELDDLQELRAAKQLEAHVPSLSLEEVKKHLLSV